MSKSAVRALIEWNPTSERIIQARYYSKYIKLTVIHVYAPTEDASSETQGQLVGAGKSRNGRVKNSGAEKSRTTRRAPGDKFLTDQFQTAHSRPHSPFLIS